jgi:serine/threonine-protein kinase HipA
VSTSAIEVFIWGQSVGAIAPDPRLGAYVFAYRPEWMKQGIELAPRTMPLSTGSAPRVFPNLPEATFHGLPGLLADALPDDFGNALIDAWMQSKGRTRESITVLDRLAYMGKRGMGALTFRPALGSHRESAAALDMKSLVEQARLAVHGALSSDRMAEAALAQIIRVGTSAGGARAKAVVAWNPSTNEIRSGQFEVEPGFEHWLLKFDGMGRDHALGTPGGYGRIEYAYHLMAKAAGIRMAPCRLLLEGGRAHFMTQRFDRDGNERHHVQTLCAMEHLDFKQKATHAYAQAFMTLSLLKVGQDGIDELFRRMAFNVMARNCDDHVKNLSFILKRGGSWDLAPAYDVSYAYMPGGEWTYQHQMSVNGRFDDITWQDLLREAERFGVRSPERILGNVDAAVASFGDFARKADLPEATCNKIRKNFPKAR